MAISLAGQTIRNSGGLNASSVSFSHTTPAGSDRLLLVIVQAWKYQTGSVPFTVSSLAYGGTSLTYINRIQAYTTNRNYTVEAWIMAAPTTGAGTVAVTFSSTVQDALIACLALNGVDQTTPIPQSDANDPQTVDISFTLATGATNAWLVGGSMVFGGTRSFTPGTGITEIWDEQTGADSSTDFTGAGSYLACTATGSYTWSQTASASTGHCGVVVEVAAATANTTVIPGAATLGLAAIAPTALLVGSATVAPGAAAAALAAVAPVVFDGTGLVLPLPAAAAFAAVAPAVLNPQTAGASLSAAVRVILLSMPVRPAYLLTATRSADLSVRKR